jgi:FkbM family methyltransferase
MTAPTATHADTGLTHRPGTSDEYVIGERGQYLRLGPTTGDLLLDVGGNIGAVAWAFASAGCPVVTVEPEPDNYRLLRANTKALGALVTPLRAAVVDDDAPHATLYLNQGTNCGAHSLMVQRGRVPLQVPAVPLRRLLDTYRPTLLKIDIEGGEYQLAPTLAALPPQVRGIAMELHLNRKAWRAQAAPRLMAALEMQGFTAMKVPHIGPKNWHTVGVWLRGTP